MKIRTKMSAGYLLIIFFVSASTVFGCINEIGGRSTVGRGIYVEKLTPEEFLKQLNTRDEDAAYWKEVLRDLKHIDGRFSPIENRNNRAVALLHLGQIKEAIKILKGIEKEKPGLYYTATNLGTAYELNGENAKALKWIKEGVTRNKDAHNGSEWLHVKILEAKLALEEDPNWLAGHTVLGINRVRNETLSTGPTVTDHLGQRLDVKQIEAALVYQLHERLEFIKPPDGVVANLLFDLSRILSITNSDEHGAAVWVFAGTYGSDLMPWSSPGIPVPGLALPLSVDAPFLIDKSYLIAGGSALLVVFGVAIVLILRRRRRTP